MKTNIEQMFSDLVTKDFDAAKEQFSYILTQKVADRLDDVKADVGSTFMNRTDLEEGIGRGLGAPGTSRGEHNAAILRKGAAGPGQKSIKSTGYSGGQTEPTVSWESVRTGRKFKDEASANADHDGKD